MRGVLRQSCKACPYMAKVKGYIGPYKSAMELHELVKADVEFYCHKSQDGLQHLCAGYAIYMTKMCKHSRNPEIKRFQDSLRGVEDDLTLASLTGDKIVEFHGK